MKRLWPRSLAGQMIALLLLALVISQGISLAIFLDERRVALRAAERAQVLSRTAAVVRLLAETPHELGLRVTEAASTPRLGFWLAAESAIEPSDEKARDNPLQQRLRTELDGSGAAPVLVRVEEPEDRFFRWRAARLRGDARDDDDDHDDDDEFDDDDEDERFDHHRWREHGHWRSRYAHRLSLTIAVGLPDGAWLNAATLVTARSRAWAWPSIVSMLAMAAAITLIVVFSVRRITQPMRSLAAAADSVGRGQEPAPLNERGPEDIRRTIRAFNEMRARLERFVQGRTRLLAAISHDLRTPITSLRLRAEFVEDPEVRDKILETLDEMLQMIEATLAFAREDAAREETRRVDLTALIQSLCDDLADNGLDVGFESGDAVVLPCRALALKRALGNLIGNAVAYGARARVALRRGEGEIAITIDDDGPGIPEADLERVFEPFLRLESSRSRETGGVGLGLAIARQIVRGHGGDVVLQNREAGGLRALVRLPEAAEG